MVNLMSQIVGARVVGGIPAELAALPLEVLIAKPLEAAVRAQAMSSLTTADFIQRVGFEVIEEQQGKPTNKVKIVEFEYEKEDEEGHEKRYILKVPLLTILPIPIIVINNITIDLEVKIRYFYEAKTDEKAELNLSAKFGGRWGPIRLNLAGSYSFKEETQTRSSVDKSAVLHITVTAGQGEMPEGLRAVLTILRDAMLKEEKRQQTGQ